MFGFYQNVGATHFVICGVLLLPKYRSYAFCDLWWMIVTKMSELRILWFEMNDFYQNTRATLLCDLWCIIATKMSELRILWFVVYVCYQNTGATHLFDLWCKIATKIPELRILWFEMNDCYQNIGATHFVIWGEWLLPKYRSYAFCDLRWMIVTKIPELRSFVICGVCLLPKYQLRILWFVVNDCYQNIRAMLLFDL